MSTTSGTEPGCLGCLFFVVLGICLIGYPFYDAYCYRTPDRSTIKKLELAASIQPNLHQNSYSLKLNAKNVDSTWLFQSIQVRLNLSLTDGRLEHFTLNHIAHEGAPLSTIVISLPQEASLYYSDGRVKDWTWNMIGSSARRRPIKLVRQITESLRSSIEALKSLGDR